MAQDARVDFEVRKGESAYRAVVRLLAILAAVGLGCFIFLKACNTNEIIWTSSAPAPGGRFLAIAQTTQTGGGPTAAEWTTVYLAAPNSRQSDWIEVLSFDSYQHGDPVPVKLRWLSPTHLSVVYVPHGTVNFQAIKAGGIDISVEEVRAGF